MQSKWFYGYSHTLQMEKWKATLIRPFYDCNRDSKADKPIQGKQYPLWFANGVTNLIGQRGERNKRQF